MSGFTDRLYAEWRLRNGSTPPRSPWLVDALALGRRVSEDNGGPKGPHRPAPKAWGQGAGAAGPRSTVVRQVPPLETRSGSAPFSHASK
jgi:hypothetical protein